MQPRKHSQILSLFSVSPLIMSHRDFFVHPNQLLIDQIKSAWLKINQNYVPFLKANGREQHFMLTTAVCFSDVVRSQF